MELQRRKKGMRLVNIKQSYMQARESPYRVLGLSSHSPLFVLYGCNHEVSDPDDFTDGETVERWEDADAQDMALTALVCEVVLVRA